MNTLSHHPPKLDSSEVLVRRYVERSEAGFGARIPKKRKAIAIDCGCTPPELANWCAVGSQTRLPLDRLRPFAAATGMSNEELAELCLVLMLEANGRKLQFDADVFAQALEWLMPATVVNDEESALVNLYRESCGLLPFSILSQDKYRNRLRQVFEQIASEAVDEYRAEGGE